MHFKSNEINEFETTKKLIRAELNSTPLHCLRDGYVHTTSIFLGTLAETQKMIFFPSNTADQVWHKSHINLITSNKNFPDNFNLA